MSLRIRPSNSWSICVVLLEDLERLGDVSSRAKASSALRSCAIASSDSNARSFTGRRSRLETPVLIRRCTVRAMRAASSPTRSRLAIVLEIGDQQPQVARRRLAPRDDGREVAVDLDLHRVDALLLRQHLRRRLAAEVGQRIDRLRHLRLDEAAHLEHAGRDAAEFGVELGGEMLVVHGRSPCLSRSAR